MLRQSSILFAAKVIGFGMRILLPVFLVRIMSKADIGLYNQFFLMEVMIQTFIQLGVNQSQYYFIPRDMKNAGAYFLNAILLNLAIFLTAYTVIGFFRDPLADFLGMPVLTMFFWQLAGYALLLVLNTTTEIYLTARKDILPAAVFDVGRQLIASIATLIAAFVTRDLSKIITALVLARLLSLILGLAYVHFAKRGFRAERYFQGIPMQVRYGLVLGIAGTIGTIVLRLHEFTVTRFYPLETYAVYSQGLKQIPILQFYTQSIASVALIRFAQLEKENDWQGIRKFWDEVMASMFGVGIPVTLFFLVVSKPLIILMYTREYIDSVPIFRMSAIAMLFNLLNPTLVLRAMDRNDISLKVNLGILLILPFSLYFGMSYFGLIGIISVHAFVLIGGRVLTQMVLNKMIPVHLPYVASFSQILQFYRSSWIKVLDWLASKRPNHG